MNGSASSCGLKRSPSFAASLFLIQGALGHRENRRSKEPPFRDSWSVQLIDTE